MINYLSFDLARNFVRQLGIRNCKEWQKYTRSSNFNALIPKAPDYYYKEWTNWYDFLDKSRDSRIYKVNDNFFKIWSHDMAYILGLWFADGHIKETSGNSHIFSIKLHERDGYLLEQVLTKINTNYPLRKENNTCYFEVNSKTIYDDIIRLGGKERKSLDVKFPNVPKKYLPDFIRGLWDGDGTISEGKRSKDGHCFGYKASIYSGSKEFMLQLKKMLEENILGVNINYYEHKTKGGEVLIRGRVLENDGVVYRLNFSPNNLRMLRDFMYSNREGELRMVRKYERFIAAGEYKPGPGDINYLSFEDAKKLMLEKNFRSMNDYHGWLKGGECNVVLPSSPDVVYKEWTNWTDFLGHNRMPYNQLSNLAKENGINGKRAYYRWIKSIRGNSWGKYPRHPQTAYSEWQGWDKFLQKV